MRRKMWKRRWKMRIAFHDFLNSFEGKRKRRKKEKWLDNLRIFDKYDNNLL